MPLHLAICSDAGLADHLPRLFWSLAKHHQAGELHLHFGNTEPNCDTFRPLVERLAEQYKLHITWYDLSNEIHQHIGTIAQPGRIAPLPSGTYARWFLLDRLDPQIERLLYLDADTLVAGSLLPLIHMNLDGAPFAAAIDWSHALEFGIPFAIHEHDTCHERLRADGLNDYVNAGVLLMDPPAWRKLRLTESLLQIRQHSLDRGITLIHEDQDVLNLWARGRMPRLNPSFNAMAFASSANSLSPLDTPRSFHLIHYAGPKPWTDNRWMKLPACFALPFLESCAHTNPCDETAERFALRASILQTISTGASWANAQHFTQRIEPIIRKAEKDHASFKLLKQDPLKSCLKLYDLSGQTHPEHIPALVFMQQCADDIFMRHSLIRSLYKYWRLPRKLNASPTLRGIFRRRIMHRILSIPRLSNADS